MLENIKKIMSKFHIKVISSEYFMMAQWAAELPHQAKDVNIMLTGGSLWGNCMKYGLQHPLWLGAIGVERRWTDRWMDGWLVGRSVSWLVGWLVVPLLRVKCSMSSWFRLPETWRASRNTPMFKTWLNEVWKCNGTKNKLSVLPI